MTYETVSTSREDKSQTSHQLVLYILLDLLSASLLHASFQVG